MHIVSNILVKNSQRTYGTTGRWSGRAGRTSVERRSRDDIGALGLSCLSVDVDGDCAITLSVSNRGKDRKSTRLNSSHSGESRMPSSA